MSVYSITEDDWNAGVVGNDNRNITPNQQCQKASIWLESNQNDHVYQILDDEEIARIIAEIEPLNNNKTEDIASKASARPSHDEAFKD